MPQKKKHINKTGYYKNSKVRKKERRVLEKEVKYGDSKDLFNDSDADFDIEKYKEDNPLILNQQVGDQNSLNKGDYLKNESLISLEKLIVELELARAQQSKKEDAIKNKKMAIKIDYIFFSAMSFAIAAIPLVVTLFPVAIGGVSAVAIGAIAVTTGIVTGAVFGAILDKAVSGAMSVINKVKSFFSSNEQNQSEISSDKYFDLTNKLDELKKEYNAKEKNFDFTDELEKKLIELEKEYNFDRKNYPENGIFKSNPQYNFADDLESGELLLNNERQSSNQRIINDVSAVDNKGLLANVKKAILSSSENNQTSPIVKLHNIDNGQKHRNSLNEKHTGGHSR